MIGNSLLLKSKALFGREGLFDEPLSTAIREGLLVKHGLCLGDTENIGSVLGSLSKELGDRGEIGTGHFVGK